MSLSWATHYAGPKEDNGCSDLHQAGLTADGSINRCDSCPRYHCSILTSMWICPEILRNAPILNYLQSIYRGCCDRLSILITESGQGWVGLSVNQWDMRRTLLSSSRKGNPLLPEGSITAASSHLWITTGMSFRMKPIVKQYQKERES